MKTKFKAKLFTNKNNKQITLIVPKKKLNIPKGKIPKLLELKIEGVEWK